MATVPVFQVKEGKWSSQKFVDVLGVKIPSYFTSDPQLLRDFISNFKTRPDDVFVASFPKSGEPVQVLMDVSLQNKITIRIQWKSYVSSYLSWNES